MPMRFPPMRFPTTRWSLVERAGAEDVAGPRPALGELLMRYLPALRAHVATRRWVNRSDIEDIVQGFISSKILERDLIGGAEESKGRFRALLTMSLDRYAISHKRHLHAAKRGGSAGATVSLDTLDAAEPHEPVEPAADRFDIEWARQLLNEAVQRMRRDCELSQRSEVWGVFEQQILRPLLTGERPPTYQVLIERFGFNSPGQLWHATRSAKRWFASALRSAVNEYAADEQEVDQEIRDLRQILARAQIDDQPA